MKNLSRSFFIFAAVQFFLFCIGFSASGVGLGGLMGAESNSDINFGNNLVIYGGVLAILAVVLFILALVAGFALRADKGWGRIVGIITAVVALFDIPIGTIFGIYWLAKFFKK